MKNAAMNPMNPMYLFGTLGGWMKKFFFFHPDFWRFLVHSGTSSQDSRVLSIFLSVFCSLLALLMYQMYIDEPLRELSAFSFLTAAGLVQTMNLCECAKYIQVHLVH